MLFHHTSLIVLPVATASTGPVWRLLTETPLAVLFAGHESVIVFFVLSGLVVTLPLMKPTNSLLAYYPSRLVRLYLPVWGALALSVILLVVIPRDPSSVTDDSWLVTTNAVSISDSDLLAQTFLTARQYDLNNPLWSLRWEVIYSLLAPLFMVIARLCRRWALIAGIAAIVIVFVGHVTQISDLIYLPPFFLGALIAVRLPDLIANRTQPRHARRWFAVLAGSFMLLATNSAILPMVEEDSLLAAVLSTLIPIAASGLVLGIIGWMPATRALERRVPQWLGTISFSLYLVHVPLLVAVAFIVGDSAWGIVLVIGIPLSLAAAAVFQRWVERPSHLLSRRVRTWIESRAKTRGS